jgi:hypothetical protein
MGVAKPGVWRFVLRLQSVYTYYEAKYVEFVNGGDVRRRSTAEETRQKKIKEAVEQFGALTEKEYLYGIVKATSC